MKYRECVCPLSWSVHFNFVRDGNRVKGGGRAPPHPYLLGLIFGMYARNRSLLLCVLYGEGRRVDRVNVFSVITFPLFLKTTEAFIFAQVPYSLATIATPLAPISTGR